VQTGTPIELFERPRHTFVGHFIGSPGMNFIPCEVRGGVATIGARSINASNARAASDGQHELGVRPEFVKFANQGLPVSVTKVADIGRMRVVETRLAEGSAVKLVVPEGEHIPEGQAHLAFDPAHSFIYTDSWLVGEARQ
jgi:glycerol transport system ATP-binding protein